MVYTAFNAICNGFNYSYDKKFYKRFNLLQIASINLFLCFNFYYIQREIFKLFPDYTLSAFSLCFVLHANEEYYNYITQLMCTLLDKVRYLYFELITISVSYLQSCAMPSN